MDITRLPYSILIQWSEEDNAYLVTLPEWERPGFHGHTHGATYTDAARMGEELLQLLVESAQEDGDTLPQPNLFPGVA
jgi:antitoxin HicB